MLNIRAKFLKRSLFIAPLSFALISWGIYGHEHINHAAVMALPQPLQHFFYNHIDFITQEAGVPDLRKYTIGDKAEFPRHFINLESYGNVDSIPRSSKDAHAKYSDAILTTNGALPWYIQDMMVKLTAAFKARQKTSVIFLASDLGHYIGDAYMPLHTALNHNGQLTNQKGVHGLFEAQIPELFGESYNYHTGPAKYISDVQAESWRIVLTTHALADLMLKVDRDLMAGLPQDKIYELDANKKIVVNKFGDYVHTYYYSKLYHDKLDGMVEKQIRGAIASTADFWYTAWVNAGKPDLSEMDSKETNDRSKPALAHELSVWQTGKLYGIKSEPEYDKNIH